jgi:hypothetical protein
MPPDVFLLRGFLPMGSVKLGRLIADLENPHDPMHDPNINIKPDSDTLISPYINYDRNQQVGAGHNLDASLPSLLSASISKTTNKSTVVNTTTATTYQLKNSRPLFKKAVQDPAARLWIEEQCDDGREELFFLIGYHTMVDAVIVLGDENKREISGQAQIPISQVLAAGGIVLPIGGITDPEISAKIERSQASSVKFVATGERICAFQYRKVKFRWFSRKNIEQATLSRHQWWHTVKTSREMQAGPADEEDAIEVFFDDEDLASDEHDDG